MSLLPCTYDAKAKAKIAKLTEKDGLKRAQYQAAKKLGHDVRKSTVQSTCSAHRNHLALARLEPQDVVELLIKQHGCPLYLGRDLDSKVVA